MPDPDRPVLLDAAKELRFNREQFAQNVKIAMAGRSVRGESFERVI